MRGAAEDLAMVHVPLTYRFGAQSSKFELAFHSNQLFLGSEENKLILLSFNKLNTHTLGSSQVAYILIWNKGIKKILLM